MKKVLINKSKYNINKIKILIKKKIKLHKMIIITISNNSNKKSLKKINKIRKLRKKM